VQTVTDRSVATTIIHIAIDPDLAAETGARWRSFSWQAVDVWLSPALTRSQQFEALSRVFDDMRVEAATGGSDQACKDMPLFPADYLACVQCGHSFHPDSSPSAEVCWSCAEILEDEAGR
jgi:hypothetical protein